LKDYVVQLGIYVIYRIFFFVLGDNTKKKFKKRKDKEIEKGESKLPFDSTLINKGHEYF